MSSTVHPAIVEVPHHFPAAWAEELIRIQVLAARLAGEQMSGPALERLLESVGRACRLPAKPGWDRKAAAHAKIFRLLADMAGGQVTVGWSVSQARLICDLMRAVGPVANGMITSSRRRLIDRLRAGDADGAAREMETHLRVLYYMWRLAEPSGSGRASRHHHSVISSMNPNGRRFHDQQECDDEARSPDRRGEAHVLTAGA